MADVLLIFVREDLAAASALARICEEAGLSIFAGAPHEARVEDYRKALLVWSESAETSEVFRESAASPITADKALVVSFAAEAPTDAGGLGSAPVFDLYDWNGKADSAEFAPVLAALTQVPAEIEPERDVEPENVEPEASDVELATVLPELDQPEPDQPEPELPELEVPDLEQPALHEPIEPMQAALDVAGPEPEDFGSVAAPEDVAEPVYFATPAAEPLVLNVVAHEEIPTQQVEPPSARRSAHAPPRRARAARIAPRRKPRPAPEPRLARIGRELAQAALLSAGVFLVLMQVGHMVLGPAAPPAAAASMESGAHHAALATLPASEARVPPAAPTLEAVPVSHAAAPDRAEPRRAAVWSAHRARGGFLPASFAAAEAEPALTTDEPSATPGEAEPQTNTVEATRSAATERRLRRFRHGSKI